MGTKLGTCSHLELLDKTALVLTTEWLKFYSEVQKKKGAESEGTGILIQEKKQLITTTRLKTMLATVICIAMLLLYSTSSSLSSSPPSSALK